MQEYQQGKWSQGKGYRCGVRLRALAGQPAEDAALRHLKAGCDGGYSGQRGWQAGHVRLHVPQQLLQLVQNLVQDGVGRLVPRQRLLGEVLVALGQALGLGEAGVEGDFFFITASISVLVIGLFIISTSSWFSLGRLNFSKNLSLSSRLSILLPYSCS